MLRDLLKEIHRLFEALLGKQSLAVWIESISKFTDDTIREVTAKDGSTYQKGTCTIEYVPGNDISAEIKMIFKAPSGQIGQVTAKRTFPKRIFLSEALEELAEKGMLELPIKAPDEE